jgi:hypothetical protein
MALTNLTVSKEVVAQEDSAAKEPFDLFDSFDSFKPLDSFDSIDSFNSFDPFDPVDLMEDESKEEIPLVRRKISVPQHQHATSPNHADTAQHVSHIPPHPINPTQSGNSATSHSPYGGESFAAMPLQRSHSTYLDHE